jgi:hypothetical protein
MAGPSLRDFEGCAAPTVSEIISETSHKTNSGPVRVQCRSTNSLTRAVNRDDFVSRWKLSNYDRADVILHNMWQHR